VIGYNSPVIRYLKQVVSEEKLDDLVLVVPPSKAAEKLSEIKNAKIVFLYTHTLSREVEEAVSRAHTVISASENYSHLTRGSPHVVRKAIEYFRLGGVENLRNLVRFLSAQTGFSIGYEEPRRIPWHAIWHPRYGVFEKLADYLKAYPGSTRPLVGILFYRTSWLYGDTEAVEALVEALEAEGLGVIPVFATGYGNVFTGEPSIEDTIRRFFLVNRKPVVDLVIDLLSFFLLRSSRQSIRRDCFARVDGVELLKQLGVPVLKAVRDSYQSIKEWLENRHGLSYMSQVYEIIMPEVDGVVEPIFYAAAVDMGDYKVYKSFKPHAKLLARRAKKWVILRRKRPCERKIAIVLNNPPCRQVEATIGVGLGLDVPESIVRLLHKLRDLGYHLGDSKLPKTGQELIMMFLERRATSEFRWTSVEDIVSRGGYVGMVDIETYMEWFLELPEKVRREMVKWWGNPREIVHSKRSMFTGAIYDGKFVVPGLRFGNVVIIPQPKFGCVGSSCSGRVCKILHNPTIPPPHQWLAVYRWIERVFNADLILHFGTHGTLEFRPGKSVGLSPYCWPEITLDDTPMLYVYVVTNPMEGVIAKRRGYAVLVDHLYPPTMTADNALEEIAELLDQYERAKRLGEKARAKKLLEDIKAKTRELGLPAKDHGETLAENLHLLITAVKETQVENGLHVFGNTPREPKVLAEHIVSTMKYDTSSWPSILRAVASYLGLDYDRVVSDPTGYCDRLDLPNSRVLDLLHRIAVRTLELLLTDNVAPDSLSSTLLSTYLAKAAQDILGGMHA